MPPDLAEVREWLRKAENDRRTAAAVMSQSPPITDVAAFHCQQSIEKLLKAFLVSRGVDFEKIHDLEALISDCARIDADFATLRTRLAPISAFAVRFRYPGPGDPTVKAVQDTLMLEDEVRRFVVERLPGGARRDPESH